jgi:membrane-bound lytic murein transglycosylase D
VQKLSRVKLFGNLPRLILLPIFLLGGCAHQPAHAPQSVAAAVIPQPPASDVPMAAPTSPEAAPAPAVADAGSPASAPAPATGVDALDSGATTDSEGLPGPPVDSLIIAKQPELFARLRAGFQLDDVDEPAVASQLNWFANHPDFLERTWGRAGLWLYYIVGQLEQRKMPA